MDGFKKAGTFFQKLFGHQNKTSSNSFNEDVTINQIFSSSNKTTFNRRRHSVHGTRNGIAISTQLTKGKREGRLLSVSVPEVEDLWEDCDRHLMANVVKDSSFPHIDTDASKKYESRVTNESFDVMTSSINKMSLKKAKNKSFLRRRSRSVHDSSNGEVVGKDDETRGRSSDDLLFNKDINKKILLGTFRNTKSVEQHNTRFRKREAIKMYCNQPDNVDPFRNASIRLSNASDSLEFPTTPESLLEYHTRKKILNTTEEWLVVELNEYECLIDSLDVVRIIACHSKFFEVEPAELWSEFFEFVEDMPSYDQVISFDVWQEFRDKRYSC